MKRSLFLLFALFLVLPLVAQIPSPSPKSVEDMSDEEIMAKLKGNSGHIDLPAGKSVLDLSGGYTFLDKKQSNFVLHDLWQNPVDDSVLGAVIPPGFDPFSNTNGWIAFIGYEDTGHVNDDDARNINYDDLLNQLRDNLKSDNEERKKAGYDELELKGWAEKPHYDTASKKMYWAKDIRTSASKDATLNYEIRILGREGVLDLNIVASMEDLKGIERSTPALLSQVNFATGQRYEDYNSSTDHLAEFGVAGLILGGIAVKAGLLKIILTFLAASWKAILVGLGAIGAFVARILGRKRAAARATQAGPAPTVTMQSNDTQANPAPETSTQTSSEAGAERGDTFQVPDEGAKPAPESGTGRDETKG